jgi:alkanesulfonate monooxygenase SsuD/methylene tetrahydromethanopterin reductase-like flavin-dependent oxidoreductase (luciferase family)
VKVSCFSPPAGRPGKSVAQIVDWTLQTIRWYEEFGFEEFWLGEHLTLPWSPIPAADLVIAQAFPETERIKLGPGGYCLPYYHPAHLAHRVAQLDHMGGGRMQFGVAAGSVPTDLSLFGIDVASGQHREMTAESLDIITKIWAAEEPFTYEGKYWTVHYPKTSENGHFGVHLRPLQQPHPPIALTGFSPYSGTIKIAGQRGYIPMSLNMSPSYIASHWEVFSQGAAEAGREASRSDWRVLREIIVADSDAAARRLAVEGPMGQFATEVFLPQMAELGALAILKDDPDMADADVTLDYLVDRSWLVGSPETVVERLEAMYETAGGFGYIQFYVFDYSDIPTAWYECLGLFASQVLPKVAHLG